MKETLATIQKMHEEGVIAAYAIGGAVGAAFYLEPAATVDVDVFVAFETSADSMLISLAPITSYLQARGCMLEGEHVVIGNWPVQFLPTSDALSDEAVAEAVAVEVEGIPTRVMTAEHLVALALQLGRGKDQARILQFIEAAAVDMKRLGEILARHGLTEKWMEFERRFPGGGA